MRSKSQDLATVFSYFPIEGLRAALQARDEDYIRGRYRAGANKGCLFFHLSRGAIGSRPMLRAFYAANPSTDPEVCGRVIAAFDASGPDFWKPCDYDTVYPPAGYQLTLADIRIALRQEIRRRAQRHAIAKPPMATRRGEPVGRDGRQQPAARQMSFLMPGGVSHAASAGASRQRLVSAVGTSA